MNNRTIWLVTDKDNNLQLLNITTNFKDLPREYQTNYTFITGPFNEDEISTHFINLKSKMVTTVPKSEDSDVKNIWIVTNENDQLEIHYAKKLQDIHNDWQKKLVAGPMSQQEFKNRILDPDFIDLRDIVDPKKENEHYWIVDMVGSHFKLVKGSKHKVNTECNNFMKKNVGIAKIHLGPYDDKNEALEDLDVVNYSFYDKTIPVHWILTYEDKTFEVFYGNKDALKIKLADEACLVYGPFLHKNRIEQTKNNMYGDCKLRKPNYENGNRFVSQLIESVYRPSLEELQDNYSKINIDYPNIQYSVVAGPFTSEQSSKYIKTLKDNDEF